jgi:hypothetical protein
VQSDAHGDGFEHHHGFHVVEESNKHRPTMPKAKSMMKLKSGMKQAGSKTKKISVHVGFTDDTEEINAEPQENSETGAMNEAQRASIRQSLSYGMGENPFAPPASPKADANIPEGFKMLNSPPPKDMPLKKLPVFRPAVSVGNLLESMGLSCSDS